MKLSESAAPGAICPECSAPLEAVSDARGGVTEAPPHDCNAASNVLDDDAGLQGADLFDGLQEGGQAEPSQNQTAQESQGTQATHNLRDDTAQSLRERGYAIDEDVHGVRISSISGARGGSSQLSAADVVSMAAELSGGIQPQTKLQLCAKCEARTPPGEPNCQWCGEPFESSAS